MKLPKPADLIVALPTIAITLMWLGSGCGKDRQESPSGNMKKRSAETPLPETSLTQTNKSHNLRPTVNADTPPNTNHVGNLKVPPMSLDDSIIKVVMDMYVTNKWDIPSRIVIHERNATNCIVKVRWDYLEATHYVDLKTMQVVRVVGF